MQLGSEFGLRSLIHDMTYPEASNNRQMDHQMDNRQMDNRQMDYQMDERQIIVVTA